MEDKDISYLKLVTALAAGIDHRPPDPPGHCWRVAVLAYRTAGFLGSKSLKEVFLAGMLADCATGHLPMHVLDMMQSKPALFDQRADLDLFMHPILAFEALYDLPRLRKAARLVIQHHETPSGQGYPEGLGTEDLPLETDCLRAADQFDVLMHDGNYESSPQAMEGLYPFVGEEIDPEAYEAMGEALRRDHLFSRLMLADELEAEVQEIVKELGNMEKPAGDKEITLLLEAFGDLIDNRNPLYASGRSRKSAELAVRIATRMQLKPDAVREIRYAALLQNLGEVSCRKCLLAKPTKLTGEERKAVLMHPKLSAWFLNKVPGLENVARTVLHHHENYDGSGYPDRLQGGNIPISSRILRVADGFVAITSDSPYQSRQSVKHALRELRRNQRKAFDPAVVQALVQVMENGSK